MTSRAGGPARLGAMASRRQLGVLVAGATILLGPGFGRADQRLQDVAGSMTLKRPDVEQLLIVDPEGSAAGSQTDATGADLIGLTEQLLESGRAASAVLDEGRSGLTFFDQGWRRRMLDALAEIDTTRFSLELVEAPERYADALGRVVDGARQYQLAAGILRWAILRDRPVFSKAFEHMRVGEREVKAALGRLRSEGVEEWNEAAPPAVDPFAAGQAMAEVCAALYAAGQGSGHDRCLERQRAALWAIEHRFSFTEGIEEPAFNAIRNRCRDEWPRDFVGRDRCERQGIADAVGD